MGKWDVMGHVSSIRHVTMDYNYLFLTPCLDLKNLKAYYYVFELGKMLRHLIDHEDVLTHLSLKDTCPRCLVICLLTQRLDLKNLKAYYYVFEIFIIFISDYTVEKIGKYMYRAV